MTSAVSNKLARRRGITFAILIAVTLVFMAFSSNPVVQDLQRGMQFALTPFQNAISSVADGISNVIGAVGEIDQLRNENARLRDENDRLTNENLRLQDFKTENENLTALLQLQSGFDHATVAVRVIGREMLETRRVVTIDKGTADGLEQGDVVIVTGGALAGRITDIGSNFAKVTLINDASSTVVGQLSTSRATGDIVGQAGDVLVMRNVDAAAEIGIDEEVFTAGIEVAGGIRSPYPKGLIVGSVVDVERDANAVVQTAYLAPAANLDSFEVALVITDYSGGLPPADQQPVPCGTSGTVPDGEVPCYTPAPTLKPTPKPTAKASSKP